MAEPQSAPSAVTTPTDDGDDWARQEIRIGAVLNGGVSLAVWMSGVVLELHHVALASQRRGQWQTYRAVLDLLHATARVDVIAGTSAGGLNGSFLALGQARHRDLALLRDLWTDKGSLEKLLRPALEKNPPSLMRGDGYFLAAIRDALRDVLKDENRVPPSAGATDDEAPPVQLILTGTLWDGRTSTFTDDMGVAITERDYDATFRFANRVPLELRGSPGDLDGDDAQIVEQLARASRCTSSFPAAFEPHFVGSVEGRAEPHRWPMTAGQANFGQPQYVLDGGILLNKPVRPALEAIYHQTGGEEVRRVLAYVVPDPGGSPGTTAGATEQPTVPKASDVLLSVLTRMRSTDSVARELAEIRSRNATARERRRARARLAGVLRAGGPPLAEELWYGYVAERTDHASATVGHLLAAGQSGSDSWSEAEITDALARIVARTLPSISFVPSTDLASALAATGTDWHWGQTTVVQLADLTADIIRRALALAPLAPTSAQIRKDLVAKRGSLTPVLDDISAEQRDLEAFWLSAPTATTDPGPAPRREVGFGATQGSAANITKLESWLQLVLTAWDNLPATTGQAGQTHASVQYDQVVALAQALLDVRTQLRAAVTAPDPGAEPWDIHQLSALIDWLLPDDATTAVDVLHRMLQLDVVLVATAGALAGVEQEVELVQVSCTDRTAVTGMQLHHFGAFYRPSWRVNDWIQGRLDGARQTIRFLLSPSRLRRRGFTVDDLLKRLRAIAVPASSSADDVRWLGERWQRMEGPLRSELAAALAGDATTSLDGTAEALMMPIALEILRFDLPALAEAIRGEDDPMPGSVAWLRSFDAAVLAAAATGGVLPAGAVWNLRTQIGQVGTQQLPSDVGSDTFARTVSHAAVVGASALATTPKISAAKPLAATMRAVRGYLATVWAIVEYLSRRSAIGPRVVSAAVAVGGTLLAVALFVPAVPIGIVVAGAVLVLAGASAAALRSPSAGALGRRLLVVAVVALLAFAGLVWWQIHEHGFGSVVGVLVKLGVGTLIVCLGWFLARAKP